MATESQNIFLTKKQKLKCSICHTAIKQGAAFVSESEKTKGSCFACSDFVHYEFLPPGNAALTRRSKSISDKCGVVYTWNQRRKRFERKGQYVTAVSIVEAKISCEKDQEKRNTNNVKAAERRVVQDKEYIEAFGIAILRFYPSCPANKEKEIAEHACLKHSGRVGRTAAAKEFDREMIDRAVEAHIRHSETNYDYQFGIGKLKREIRTDVKNEVVRIMKKWSRN